MAKDLINIKWYETIIILLNISIFNTIIPSLIFGAFEWYIHMTIILIINIIYIFLNLKNSESLFNITRLSPIILILLLIYFFEIPRYMFSSNIGRDLYLTFLNALSFITFWLILNFVYKRSVDSINVFKSIISKYIYFSIIIVSLSVFIFFLIKIGIINHLDYPLIRGVSSHVDNNVETMGSKYYFPLNLVVIIDNVRGSGNFFTNLGLFCGLSHEPHIASYFLTPALFLMWGIKLFTKKLRYIFSLIFIVFILSASSVTNILSLLLVALIFIVRNFFYLKDKLKYFLFIIFIFILTIYGYYSNFIEELGLDFINDKLNSEGGSVDYSKNFIAYILTPETFFGDGVFNVPYPYAQVNDIGFIFMFFILCFYILTFFYSLKLLLNNEILFVSIGLSGIYFIFHSLKIPQLIFIYPFTIFIVFLLIKANNFISLKIFNK